MTFKPPYWYHDNVEFSYEDLKEINLPGMVSVYLPHSYNFSGNVFITDKKNIKPLKNTSADVMKYIVSGGISGKIKA